ncbi:conserved hypothetical protein, partial [Ricinus communis]
MRRGTVFTRPGHSLSGPVRLPRFLLGAKECLPPRRLSFAVVLAQPSRDGPTTFRRSVGSGHAIFRMPEIGSKGTEVAKTAARFIGRQVYSRAMRPFSGFPPATLKKKKSMSTKFAISIAVENYTDSRISPVRHAANDAKRVAEALVSVGVPDSNCTTLVDGDATKTRIESAIRTCCGHLEEDDELFLFYAGHGWADSAHNYITCHDTLRHDLPNTSVSLGWVLDEIKSSKCSKVWLFLDACHSGWAINEEMRSLFADMTDKEFVDFCSQSEHHLAFAACKMDQSSWSSTKLQHGIWTYHLIEALEGRAPKALERSKFVTATSLQNYLREV